MSVVCPAGHTSSSLDYCDTCGAPMAAPAGANGARVAGGSPPGGSQRNETGQTVTTGSPSAGNGQDANGVPGPKTCPHCGTDNVDEALFCESCGYDFTTGTAPRPPDEAPVLDNGAPAGEAQPMPPPALPVAPAVEPASVVEIWVDPDWHQAQESEVACPSPGLPVVVSLRARSVLVGRASVSRGISPDVDCGSDIGVSRRHAQLTSDGQRWWVEDLQSANGTFVGPASGPLPAAPIPGGRRELSEDDRIYVGAWTRLVVRDATPEERSGIA